MIYQCFVCRRCGLRLKECIELQTTHYHLRILGIMTIETKI